MKNNIKELLEFFESKDDGYYERGSQYFEVNVKRYHDYCDSGELIEKYPVRYQKRLKEYFTDDVLSDSYQWWLEYETKYLIEDAIKRHCMNTSESWWKENVEKKILIGHKTGYSQIDETESKAEKLNILQSWIKKDNEEIAMFEIVDKIHQLGRSGGHICFTIHYSESELSDVDAGYVEDKEEIKRIVEEAEEMKDKVLKLKTFIDNFNKNLSWHDELKFRIDEKIDELRHEDSENSKITKEAHESKTSTMQSTLSELLLSKDEQVKRLAKGIYKQISK